MEKLVKDSGPATSYAAVFFVKDLDKQIEFYTNTIGLDLQWRTAEEAGLGGCSTNVLLLKKNERKEPQSLTIVLPSRRELAKVVGRLCTIKYRNQSFDYGDKQVAVINDPEENTISVVVNIAGESRPASPLDIESLFNQLDPDDRLCDKMSNQARVSQQE